MCCIQLVNYVDTFISFYALMLECIKKREITIQTKYYSAEYK